MTSEQHTPLPAEMTDEHGPPRARLLRLPEVIARVGMSRSTIYQRMSEGRFPKSRSLGPKCAVWIEAEIDDWVQSIVQGASSTGQ